VATFAFSPNYASDHVVYAGTYSGVYRSTDSGFNWSPIGTTGSTIAGAINSLAVSPGYANDKTLFAGTANGVFMMANANTAVAGTDWIDITNDIADSSVLVIAFSPNYASDHILFAGTFGSGLFKTTNINGASTSWSVAGSLLNTMSSRIASIVFTPDYATSHTLFVGASAGSNFGGAYVSTNSGDSWTRIVNGLADGVHLNVTALVISDNYLIDHTIFAGVSAGQGVYKSTDGGSTWNFLAGTEHLYIQAMVISPSYSTDGTVFAGEDGSGVYVTTDGGTSWAEMNTGFDDGKSVLALAIPPGQSRQPFNLFAGAFSDQVWQMLYQGTLKVFIPLTIR
jgi:photosystem II stability/assembly factor-like uncharacterized protein